MPRDRLYDQLNEAGKRLVDLRVRDLIADLEERLFESDGDPAEDACTAAEVFDLHQLVTDSMPFLPASSGVVEGQEAENDG